jgi:anti-anti-sigma factor
MDLGKHHQIALSQQGGKVILNFKIPKVDTLQTEEIKSDVDRVITSTSDRGEVIFDLHDVNYVTSAFLSLTLKVAKTLKKKQCNFYIHNTTPKVKEILKFAGFDKLLKID